MNTYVAAIETPSLRIEVRITPARAYEDMDELSELAQIGALQIKRHCARTNHTPTDTEEVPF